jgi:hypothetical protein
MGGHFIRVFDFLFKKNNFNPVNINTMSTTPTKKAILLLFATGLLITATTQLLSHYISMPDLVLGSLMGLGIGIEIIALLRLKKIKNGEQLWRIGKK